jgi:ubiquinone/menaquinone biosynthesis C-methylase UbiE
MSSLPIREPESATGPYFESVAQYWKYIYQESNLNARIHQQRMAVALDWIDSLKLPPGEKVLEVGCGAGLSSVALALRGYCVSATDIAQNMIELTDAHAREAGVGSLVITSVGDVHQLAFANSSFALVFALGVIPWLHSPERAVQEMGRVVKPGGYVLVNADNRWRLDHLFDPMMNPLLLPLRHMLGRQLRLIGLLPPPAPRPRTHSVRCFDQVLEAAGLQKIRGVTLGFGPFSFFTRKYIPESAGLWLHNKLQRIANQGMPLVRSAGAQYLVLARKMSPQAA